MTILDVVESHNEMKITSPPGRRLPLLAAATGKVFLAQFEEEKAKEIIQKMGLARFTPKSIFDLKKFHKEAEETKKRGYAIDNEEYMLGVRTIAAPLQTDSPPPAAIWVAGFTSSLDDHKMKTVIREIQEATREINQSLGATHKNGRGQ